MPRNLKNEIILTMTWIGSEFQLNLVAETFIDSDKGKRDGESCVLSFGQPKCNGMELLWSRDKKVLGDTIRMNSNIFYDGDKKLIADKRMLLYVTDIADKKGKEIYASNAIIGITMPETGQVSEIGVPFKTAEEEANTLGVPTTNWAALCLWVEANAETGIEELRMKRLNGLASSKPNAVELCGKKLPAAQ